MSDAEKFKEELPSKDKFYSLLRAKKNLVRKSMNISLRFRIDLK